MDADAVPIFTIAYRSRNLIEEQKLDSSAELKRLLETSRARNAKLGITGALLFNEGRFVQIFEGDSGAVLDLLGDILKDTRHTDVDILPSRMIERRVFARWSMAYVGLSKGAREYYEEFSLARKLEWTEASAEALGQLLLDLIVTESAKAPTTPTEAEPGK